MKCWLYIISFLLFNLSIRAQSTIAYSQINPTSSPQFTTSTSAKNEKHLFSISRSLIERHISAGYLTSRVDSISFNPSGSVIIVDRGEKYEWGTISLSDQLIEHDKIIRLRAPKLEGLPITMNEYITLIKKGLNYFENHGYPFAQISLEQISIQDSAVSGTLILNKQQLIKIDSLFIHGDAKISKTYIENYLKLNQGDNYNEEVLNAISTRIKELAFVSEEKESEVSFFQEYTKLDVFLKHKKASKLSGIVGILPDNQTGKVLVTGDAQMKLINALGKGELIDVNWNKLQLNTSDLTAKLNYPFVFNSPFGFNFAMKLYKRDTIFSTTNSDVGIQYILKGGNYYSAFVQTKATSLLSTSNYQNITKLPKYADTKLISYGLGLNKTKLDYRLNPTKGYMFMASTAIGTKEILVNPNLPEQIYDSLQLQSIQLNGTLNANYFVPIGEQATFMIGLQGGHIINSSMFENEMFRIGGLKTLRGFNEESIAASSYTIGTVEFRYLLEQNSYAHLFIDAAYYEFNSVEQHISDTPFGFGGGISFETKAGIFSVSYALGNRKDNPLLFKTAKVHFGFVNYF